MQTHSNSPEAVKKRLTAILDHHMKKIAEQMQKEKRKVIVFNEALLEEWSEMLERIIFVKDVKPPIAKSISHEEKNQMPSIRYFPNPAQPP
jgi:signal recognition particle GTPase